MVGWDRLLTNYAKLGESASDSLRNVEEYLWAVGGTIVAGGDPYDLPHFLLSSSFQFLKIAPSLVEQDPAEPVRLPWYLVRGYI